MSTVGIKRKHLSEKAWREIFGRFDASGQPLTVFCRNEGLNTHSFRRWRHRLGLLAVSTSRTPTPSSAAAAQLSAQVPAAKFIDLGALPGRSLGPGRLELTLDLGGGVNLRLVRG